MKVADPIYINLIEINTKKGKPTRETIRACSIIRKGLLSGELKEQQNVDLDTIDEFKKRYVKLGFDILLALWTDTYYKLDMFNKICGNKSKAMFITMNTLIAISEVIEENQK